MSGECALSSEQRDYINLRAIEEIPAYIRGRIILSVGTEEYGGNIVVNAIELITKECFEIFPSLKLRPKTFTRGIERYVMRTISHPIRT